MFAAQTVERPAMVEHAKILVSVQEPPKGMQGRFPYKYKAKLSWTGDWIGKCLPPKRCGIILCKGTTSAQTA